MIKKVKVRIKDDYTGHHHEGTECQPGDEIEVWEDKVPWLLEIGAIENPGSASPEVEEEEEDDPEPPEPTGDE